jgi:diaminopimelate decarboxylase
MIVAEGKELYVGGLPVTRLVEKYGEPMYVYDAEVIESQYRKLKSVLPEQIEIFYSMKANPNVSLVSFLSRLTTGVDVSSLREMYVAEQAGFTPDRMLFVGPSKSERELREAIGKKIFLLVVESEQELLQADKIAGELGVTANVALRINPAFDAAGSKLMMGGGARQFGVDEEGVEPILRNAATLRHARVTGIHVYLGTRILDYDVAWKNTRYVLELAQRLREAAGIQLSLVDFGGGLGVPYFNGEHDFDIEKFGEEFRKFFDAYLASMPPTRFIMELGRYLVAESGIYVTRARYVKKSRGQKFVLVSGGMNHHQATTSIGTLVKNHFPMEILNKMGLPKEEEAHVCGPLCTPADVLGKSVKMAEVEPGDLLGLLKSGAYGLTASPLKFLSHDHPIEVMVYKGKDYLIREESSVADIMNSQVLVTVDEGAAAFSTAS